MASSDGPQTVAEFVSAMAQAGGDITSARMRLAAIKRQADDAGLNRRALKVVADNRHEGAEFWLKVGEHLNQLPSPRKDRSDEQD